MEGIPNLRDHVVGSVPTVFYVPGFIDEAEESKLLDDINNVPVSKWKTLRNRRFQNWGDVVHEKGLLPQELPSWLTKVTGRICGGTGLFPLLINHVFINEYLPHQGIVPHQDGPAYYPVVAILSLGSPVALNFSPHQRLIETANILEGNGKKRCDAESLSTADAVYGPKEVSCSQRNIGRHFSVIMMPRSLLIFKDNAHSDYLHGIEDSNIHRVDEVKVFLVIYDDGIFSKNGKLKMLRDGGDEECLRPTNKMDKSMQILEDPEVSHQHEAFWFPLLQGYARAYASFQAEKHIQDWDPSFVNLSFGLEGSQESV